MREHDKFAVVRADACWVIGGLVDAVIDADGVALRNTESEGWVRHPILNPLSVSTLKVALASARVKDPTHVTIGFGMFRPLPSACGAYQDALEERRLNPLAASGVQTGP
ncbi:unannotated protein [freshwater metagenome]|uniref:Unannotated protein n=1 Tax=freshwater metagenome TaxID=449393 RepID=A0A6J7M7Q3_9ZZZZ